MSKLISWNRFVQRKQINVQKLLSRFETYQEFCNWFIRLGGSPPPHDEVAKYFEVAPSPEPAPEPIVADSIIHEPKEKPKVGMKNTKVQLLELAAAHDVVVSYYDKKAVILREMKKSGKFLVTSASKR
mgnify:CR=1 FL=1